MRCSPSTRVNCDRPNHAAAILYSLSAWRAISGPRSGLGRAASGQRQERPRRAWDAWRETRRGGTSSECRCASARGGRDPVRRLSSLHRQNNASGGSIIRSARASPHGRWRCHSIAGRRGAGPRALDGEVSSRLHVKTGLKFDIAYRNPIGLRASHTVIGRVAGPFSPQLVERLAFIVYAGLESRRLGFGKNRGLRILTHAFDIGCWEAIHGSGREGQMRQECQSADTCESDFTQHDDLLRFAPRNRRKCKRIA